MSTLTLDPSRSRLVVRTRAKGLLGKLAHDLELESRALSGRVELDGERHSATLTLPSASLRVSGVLKGGALDRGTLSPSDVTDIEARMRRDVLRASELSARAEGTGRARSLARASVGGPEAKAELSLTVEARGDELSVTARGVVSLRALGAPEIKGPLGAFKVSDELEIELAATFAPASPGGAA